MTTTELVEHNNNTSAVDNTICFHDNSDGHHANLTYFDNVEFSGDTEQTDNETNNGVQCDVRTNNGSYTALGDRRFVSSSVVWLKSHFVLEIRAVWRHQTPI